MRGSSKQELSKAKQTYFKSIITDINEEQVRICALLHENFGLCYSLLQTERWKLYTADFGFRSDVIRTSILRELVRQGVPCRFRGTNVTFGMEATSFSHPVPLSRLTLVCVVWSAIQTSELSARVRESPERERGARDTCNGRD